MPEVDPENLENLYPLANAEACEQYNRWMSEHTRSACGMKYGRFRIYWWAMFHEHNEWVLKNAAARRRRFARGYMAHDPDKVRRHPRSGRVADMSGDAQVRSASA